MAAGEELPPQLVRKREEFVVGSYKPCRLPHPHPLRIMILTAKNKASQLRTKQKADLVKQLEDLKKELSDVSGWWLQMNADKHLGPLSLPLYWGKGIRNTMPAT